MTKRPSKRRDLVKYPLNPQEIMELQKIMRSTVRQEQRAQKVLDFMYRAHKHNTERGIHPKSTKEKD